MQIIDFNVVTVGKQLLLMMDPEFMDLPHLTDTNQVNYSYCYFLSERSVIMEKFYFLL